MRSRVSRFLLLTCVAAAAAYAQEPKKCSASARECEISIRQMMNGRRYLGLEVVDLKPGIIVKTVVDDSPAQRSGFNADDRLIAVNGRAMTRATVREFKQALSETNGSGVLWVIIQRRGAYRKLDVRLEPYTKAQIDKIVAAHLSQSHSSAAVAGQ
jgi:predicted metalloprotease with PDZ domain